jgi:hypothetical protein
MKLTESQRVNSGVYELEKLSRCMIVTKSGHTFSCFEFYLITSSHQINN